MFYTISWMYSPSQVIFFNYPLGTKGNCCEGKKIESKKMTCYNTATKKGAIAKHRNKRKRNAQSSGFETVPGVYMLNLTFEK